MFSKLLEYHEPEKKLKHHEKILKTQESGEVRDVKRKQNTGMYYLAYTKITNPRIIY